MRKFWYTQIDTDDLYQIACIGFIKAIKRFNFDYNVELSTYATEYILGEIKKYLRDDGIVKISRNIKNLNKKINEIERKYGSDLTTSQLANILCVQEKDIISALKTRKQIESVNDENFYEQIAVNQSYEDNIIEKILVLNIINHLKMRDKTIIILRYYKLKTQSQIADLLGISQVQVSRLEKRALIQLKSELVRGEKSY